MAELDFERRLERLFSDAPELPDATAFAERIAPDVGAPRAVAALEELAGSSTAAAVPPDDASSVR